MNRTREREQTGAMGFGDGEGCDFVDVADSIAADKMSLSIAERGGHPLDRGILLDLQKHLESGAATADRDLALMTLPLVQEGYGRTEIADRLGVTKAAVSRGLTYLRRSTREWMGS